MKSTTPSVTSASLASLELDTLHTITGGCAVCGCDQPAAAPAQQAAGGAPAKAPGANLMQLITAGMSAFGGAAK